MLEDQTYCYTAERRLLRSAFVQVFVVHHRARSRRKIVASELSHIDQPVPDRRSRTSGREGSVHLGSSLSPGCVRNRIAWLHASRRSILLAGAPPSTPAQDLWISPPPEAACSYRPPSCYYWTASPR